MYNVEYYLRTCLDSILIQNYSDLELLLVNDGSTDSSVAICEEYAKKYTSVIVLHQENAGQSAARNVGLKKATGDYIWFIDSDDWIVESSLELLANVLKNSTTEILSFCNLDYLNGNVIPSDINFPETIAACNGSEYLKKTNYFYTSPCVRLFKRDFLVQYAITFIEGIYHEDDFFNYQCMNEVKSIQEIPNALYVYRKRDGSTTTSLKFEVISKRIASLFFIIDNIKKFEKIDRIYINKRIIAYKDFILAIGESYCKSNATFRQKLKLINEVKKGLPKVLVSKQDYKKSRVIWLQKKLYNMGTFLYCSYFTLLKKG